MNEFILGVRYSGKQGSFCPLFYEFHHFSGKTGLYCPNTGVLDYSFHRMVTGRAESHFMRAFRALGRTETVQSK